MQKRNTGFTLIELLVVIAIIGILSSIVIASLNSARTRGSDSAAKGQMGQIMNQAEIYFEGQTPKSYTNVCTGDAAVVRMLTELTKQVSGTPTCDSSANSAVLGVTLKGGGSWCVDTGGKRASTTVNTGTDLCN